MKKLDIKIIDEYKSYKANTSYSLEGDLVVLSGVNGSGKSQLLNVIAKNGKDKIKRNLILTSDNGESISPENILLLSFRDNINFGNEFGRYSVTYKQSNFEQAWQYYTQNIQYHLNYGDYTKQLRRQKFFDGTLIFNDDGIKNPSWRSILQLVDIIKKNYHDEKMFNLTKLELESIMPLNFIWRNENDIIQQVGNIFYLACCDRANQQIKYSKTHDIFDNDSWLQTAPWTILNKLFQELNFKYQFKNDYEFNTPNMEENPILREDTEIRQLNDLSDGEKAILKLALISLDEEISKDLSIVLFDEYDAPLNPSLTEAFYHVIQQFYIEKGIQVILTTHSPATISLAPDNARFYEVFSQTDASPKIVEVGQYEYEEIREANKVFYDKIKNQKERIEGLERERLISDRQLCVEDKYDQIYKIAYLKLKGIDGLTVENLDQKFEENANFSIHGAYSTGGLYNVLNCSNVSHDFDNHVVCLFDFDNEGYGKFKKLKDTNCFDSERGSISSGLFKKHRQINRFALMLPVPERLKKYVSQKSSSDCFIEIESLISEEYLKSNCKAELRSDALPFYKAKDEHKRDFWIDLLSADGTCFLDFEPLFSTIEYLFSFNDGKKM